MIAVRKPLACLGAGLCLALLTAGPMPAQTFTDTTEVTAVEIPVQVLLDGKPVLGLEARDFVVYQEKKKQDITGFEVVDLLSLPGEKADEVPTPARRHFLFLFDLSFSEPKAISQARTAAKDLLSSLHPADVVGVATYAASRGPELVLGFTPDRAQAQAAIDTLGLPELIDRNPDPLRLVVDNARQGAAEAAQVIEQAELSAIDASVDAPLPSELAHAIANLEVLDQMERAERAIDRVDVETQKQKVADLTASFTDLARLLRTVQGRKYVVYLSEGFDSSILTGTRDKADLAESQDAGEKGRFWEVDTAQRFGHGTALNDVAAMLEEFRRADCIIQSVDIGGLRAGSDLGYERQGGRETLFQMARDTGGDLFENFNDLSTAMGKMLERTRVTYVLTIQPAAAADGKYHRLKVELRGGPKGARVVHRPGYFGPSPFAQQSRIERMMATAGQVLFGEESGSLRTSVLAAPLPGSVEGTADVPVLIEIDGPSLLHLHEGPDVPTEIYVYAVDGQGRVSDYLAQTLSLDLLRVERKILSAGLKFYGHLELPPGRHTARVLVRNGRTGRHALKVLSIDVPGLDTAGPVLLPPFFPEPQGEWLITREAQRPGRREVPLPFRLGDEPFLPASMPVLDDARETRFALIGRNLDGDLQVRSQVLTADGREVGKGDLALVGRAPGAAGQGDRLEMTFRPAALAPGEYLLRVTVTDAAGKTGTSTTPFVVAASAPGERS